MNTQQRFELLDIKYIMQLYFQGEVTLTDKEFIALRGRKMELEKML